MEKQFPVHIVAAAAFIENEKEQVLLVNQTRGWGIPGGQVEVGENLIDAVLREIEEESGIVAAIDRLVGVSSNTSTYMGYNGYGMVPPKVIFDFVGHYISGEPRGSDETIEARWVEKNQLIEYITVPVMLARLRAYLGDKQGVQYLAYETKPDYRLELERHV